MDELIQQTFMHLVCFSGCPGTWGYLLEQKKSPSLDFDFRGKTITKQTNFDSRKCCEESKLG